MVNKVAVLKHYSLYVFTEVDKINKGVSNGILKCESFFVTFLLLIIFLRVSSVHRRLVLKFGLDCLVTDIFILGCFCVNVAESFCFLVYTAGMHLQLLCLFNSRLLRSNLDWCNFLWDRIYICFKIDFLCSVLVIYQIRKNKSKSNYPSSIKPN